MEYICSKKVEQKLEHFYRLLDEGWSPAYARGLAKIATVDDKYLRNKYKKYADLFSRRKGRIAWADYENGNIRK
jgi:hypothetical protein